MEVVMYRKILVPLDGSPFSECALSHVKSIAAGCAVPEIILLFVVEQPVAGAGYEVPDEWVEDSTKKAAEFAQNYLNGIAQELRKDNLVVNPVILQGSPAELILSYAEKNGVDLIITSTHGRSGVSRWVFGSVADRVVHHSSVPVLIVSPSECRTYLSE
jgi:nucleotide-binding universal stress UspA family protein